MTSTSLPSATGLPSDRRTFLSTAAIVAATAALSASTAQAFSGNRDAKLLALRAPFLKTMARLKVTAAAHSRLEEAFFQRRLCLPEADQHLVKEDPELIEAEALYIKTDRTNHKIVEAMCEIPAHTVEGLAFKALVSSKHEENLFAPLIESIMDDILAMAGGGANA